jgi:RHS repeat-associated protein
VTFIDGVTTLGMAALVNGKVSVSTSFNTLGDHLITVSYGGDGKNKPAVSAPVAVRVQTASAVVLAMVPPATTNVTYGNNASLVAKVSGADPNGTVTFKDGGVVIGTANVVNGEALFAKRMLVQGVHPLTAVYGGDAANAASSSAPLNVNVLKKPASLTGKWSSNPVVVGRTTTLTVIVTGYKPTGTITISGSSITPVVATVVNGIATANLSFSTPQALLLTATYSGDANHSGLNLILKSLSVAAQSSTKISVTPSATAVIPNQAVPITVSVTGSLPTGLVTLLDGNTSLGSINLFQGQATFKPSFSVVGTHTLSASYAGDALNTASTSSIANVSVTNGIVAKSRVMLSVAPNPAVQGKQITLVANIWGVNPGGNVTFYDGPNALNVPYNMPPSGQSNFQLRLVLPNDMAHLVSPGLHTISVKYGGDAHNTSGGASMQLDAQLGWQAPAWVDPGFETWTYSYDAEGRSNGVTDPDGNATMLAYEDTILRQTINQPVFMTGVPNPVIHIDHDGMGQIVKVTDPRTTPVIPIATTYTVNGLGGVTNISSPDAGNSANTYDESGNLLQSTGSLGLSVERTYDVLGRLQRIDYLGGISTEFEYDGGSPAVPALIGKLTRFMDESGSTSYGYDGYGQITSKIQNVVSLLGARNFSVGYGWGSGPRLEGKRVSVNYPSGLQVNYDYDTGGRISAITLHPVKSDGSSTNMGQTLNLMTGITYSLDKSVAWTWGDGFTYERRFDVYGRASMYPLGYPMGSGVASGAQRVVTYDDAGKTAAYTHVWGNINYYSLLWGTGVPLPQYDQYFAYDALGHVVVVVNPSTGFMNYTYDASNNLGNIATANAWNSAWKFDTASNQLLSWQDPVQGVMSRAHNAEGSVITDANQTYAYSDRGRMASATNAGGTTSFLYNALEQRVIKSGPLVPTGAAYFVYDEEGHVLGEYNASGQPIYEVIWMGDQPVASVSQTRTGSGATLAVQTSVGYIYADHLNTPRVIARSGDHAIIWRWDSWDAYGTAPPNQNAYLFNLRFPGQVFDKETGLFQNHHRDYDPATGRYLQSDPIGLAGGINTYGYVGGNPLGNIDPLGLWAWGDSLPQGLVDMSAGFGDGIISTLTFGGLSGQGFRDGLDIDGGVNYCSSFYKGGRIAGATVTLLANAAGAIPKTLTHFTTQAGANGIAQSGIRASSGGLFGGGRYASSVGAFPRNPFVPPGSTVGIAINDTAGYVRAIPGTFLNPTASGNVQLGVMNATYGSAANRDMFDKKCGCENQ